MEQFTQLGLQLTPTRTITLEKDIRITPSDGEIVLIICPAGKQYTVHEQGEGTFTIVLLIHENAQLQYTALAQGTQVARHARLENDARIIWTDIACGAAQTETTSHLVGVGSDARYSSVFLGVATELYGIKSNMIHLGNHTTSNMLTRAVLMDKSKGYYEGLIKIDENAKGCDAYQKEETLLLSDDARMDATPNLEISNEDVRCSHGVSLGQVDEEQLFYFQARGITRKRAVRMLVEGFLSSMVDAAPTSMKDVLFSRLEAHNE